jgi:hypothetical protein
MEEVVAVDLTAWWGEGDQRGGIEALQAVEC